jgi:hypothetical protein
MPRLLEEEEPIDPEASLGTVLATSVVLGVVHVLTGPDHLSGPSSLTHPSALMLLSGRAALRAAVWHCAELRCQPPSRFC